MNGAPEGLPATRERSAGPPGRLEAAHLLLGRPALAQPARACPPPRAWCLASGRHCLGLSSRPLCSRWPVRRAARPGETRPRPAGSAQAPPRANHGSAPRAPAPSLHVPSCPFMCLYTSSRVPPLSLSPRPPLLPPLSLDARRTVHVRVRVRVPSFVQRTRTALRMCPFPHGEVPVIGDTVCSSSSPGGGPGTTPGCRAGPRTLSARSLDETCAACARAHLCVAYVALAC